MTDATLDGILPFLSIHEPWAQALGGLAVLALLAIATGWIARRALLHVARRSAGSLQGRWSRIFLDATVLNRFARIMPWLLVQVGIDGVPHLPAAGATAIRNVAVAIMVLHLARTLTALLDALHLEHERSGRTEAYPTRSIKSHIQLAKLAIMLVGAIVIIAALIDRSPLILFSGLGAISAVLMLVFKDTLLSFTAGLQLSSNDMLRVGDWIQMPQLGADGTVIDVALHTVKVQNWDKTITTIPTWRLMSESFRNWRGMSESGGRRIKRTLRLDAASVRFLDGGEIARLKKVALLAPYLERKEREVRDTNLSLAEKLGELAQTPANRRRLTNIGTFRAYADAYLRSHPGIHQDMTLMVRAMEPSSEGVPMEIYCFTSTTSWVQYEGIQSDLFDHLLAILPEFGLRLYQKPSGHDIGQALAIGLREEV